MRKHLEFQGFCLLALTAFRTECGGQGVLLPDCPAYCKGTTLPRRWRSWRKAGTPFSVPWGL